MQKQEIEQQVDMHKTAIEKSETLLKRSTSAQIMQPIESLEKLLQEEGDQDDTAYRNGGSFPNCYFMENQEWCDQVVAGQIGFLLFSDTRQQKSIAEGTGISEATVGLEAQIVVTTRNAQGERCYEDRDCVTVEITNLQGHDCATKAQVQDNKDGIFKISYFSKET